MGTTFVFFKYGPTSAYGSTTISQGIGNGNAPVNVSIPVTGLLPGTVYHYRLFATNSLGTVRQATHATFTAGYFPPLVTTGTAVALTSTSATLYGTVRARGGNAEVWFDYGTDGVNFPNSNQAVPATVTGDAETPVSVDLANLNGVVTYYYRVRAISSGGTGTGDVASFQIGALPRTGSGFHPGCSRRRPPGTSAGKPSTRRHRRLAFRRRVAVAGLGRRGHRLDHG